MLSPFTDRHVFDAFPDVPIDRDNIEHYRGLLERRLLVNRCLDCGWWIMPHRPLCPRCWSWQVEPREVSGRGHVHLFTLIHQLRDPNGFLATPMPVAAVELAEQQGLRYLARVDCPPDAIALDLPVRLTWIKDEGLYWPAFEPAPEDA